MNVAIAKNNRLQYIDNLKGFAIVLVVIGHVIQCMYAPGTYQDNVLFRYIYSFHMPLFMMLSGMTLNIHKRIPMENLPKFIGRRFLQLVVPFVVWGLITTNTSSVSPFYKIFVQPDLSLWFLWTLFWIYTTCICGLSIQQNFFKGNPLISVIVIYILLTIVRLAVHGKYGIGMISSYYLYYSIGIVLGGV